MRVVQNTQMVIGEVDISQIDFDLKSRDDMPRILRGLQHLYMNPMLRAEIFELLEQKMAPNVDKSNGRPGMALWNIFVCGVVRLDLNIDYDHLHELMNQHLTLRQVLGHGPFSDAYYEYETVKDNARLITPELMDAINQVVVNTGHVELKKKDVEALRGRCDSFVVKTDVHFPTDINLLYDGMRKVITLTARLCEQHQVEGWRQYAYNVRHVKRLMRTAQNSKRSKARDEAKREKQETLIASAHEAYLDVAKRYLNKAGESLGHLLQSGCLTQLDLVKKLEIEGFMQHAERQIDQTRRRVLEGEIIPHHEKVFSIFEPHTEWISKGKAGVPVELGVKVCVLEDQFGFILHHQVMEKKTDDQVAISMVRQAKERFPKLNACSFDKGFHSKENQVALGEQLKQVVMPRKGKLSRAAKEVEQTREFIKARRAHSAVESAINALGVHGLDMCPDHGILGFKRYVALAVVARNIHRLGAILWQRDQERKRRSRQHAPPRLLAA